jgi:hypothetical protein
MKKNLLFSSLMMLSISIFAQGPTLTLSNFGIILGTTVNKYNCDTLNVTPGNNGANVTWNYSNISINTNNQLQVNYVNPSTLSGSSSFPTANVAEVSQSNETYYKYSTSELIQLGTDADGTIMVYSDPAKVMIFPTSYNSSFTDTYNATYNYMGINFNRNGTINSNADAWGKLILPGKIYNSVIRIKQVQTVVDQCAYYTQNSIITSYLWFDGIVKSPVFVIVIGSSNNTLQPGLTSTIKAVMVDNSVVGINETNQQQPTWTIYPNPAANSSTIAIESSVNNGVLEIYNSLGSKVYSQNINNESNSQISLNTQDFTNGIYIVSLKSDNQTWQKKLIINK